MTDYIKVSALSPKLKVADVEFNKNEILLLIENLHYDKVKVALFPELSLTGYSAGDIFLTVDLLDAAEAALKDVTEKTTGMDMVVILGLPLRRSNRLFNVAAVIFDGKILGIIPKKNIPNYNEFYEGRWFTPYTDDMGKSIRLFAETDVPFGSLVFKTSDYSFGVEICEDLFATNSPSANLSLDGAEIIFNLSASNELVGKSGYRNDLVRITSAKNIGAYVYASSGVNESSTDLVFGGHLMIAEYGTLLKENERFSLESDKISAFIDIARIKGERLRNTTFRNESSNANVKSELIYFKQNDFSLDNFDRFIDAHPFVPKDPRERKTRAKEILNIQSHGLIKRLTHINMKKTVIGISGGLDSTLALLVIVKAYKIMKLPMSDIITITMPGFGTTDRTYSNAIELCKELGTDFREINIVEAALKHFEDIGHAKEIHDATYENVQARERTQILMDIANKENGIVVGTGDLSELALGWCTYNGDQMSMYGVNASVPKTLVRYLVRYFFEEEFDGRISMILRDILDTPVSPELLPTGENNEMLQMTEDIIGPYELHDFFLYHYMKYGASFKKILFMAEIAFKDTYGKEEIKSWLKVFIRRFYTQQFKRSAMPDGPKVGSISLSPRGDLRMPSDASFKTFLDSIE